MPKAPQVTLSTDEFKLIPLSLIIPADDNVRDDVGDVSDLAHSILQNGLQQPLRVRPIEGGGYQIVAGHRRFAAISTLTKDKQHEIPCMVIVGEMLDDARVAAMLVENMQRTDLNPIEEAVGFMRLTSQFGYKQAELAGRIGRSASYVSARLSLLKLPDEVVDQVRTGNLPLAIAESLTKVGDDAAVLKLTKQGSLVPSESQINDVIKDIKFKAAKKALLTAAETIGLRLSTERPEHNTKVLLETSDAKELAAAVALPAKAVGYIKAQPWDGKVSIDVRRPMTDKEITKRDEQQAASRDKITEEIKAQRAADEAARRESMPEELVAWEDECKRLRREHNEALDQHKDNVNSAMSAWYREVDAKAVTRWLMIGYVTDAWPNAILRALEIPVDIDGNESATDALVAFASESAANLVACVAASLDLNDDTHLPNDFYDARNKWLAKHELLNEPQLVLPERPAPADEPVEDEPAA